jgi:transposase-like protein
MKSHGTSSKYPRELRERAVRLVLESKDEYPSEFEVIRSIAGKLGIGSSDTAQVSTPRGDRRRHPAGQDVGGDHRDPAAEEGDR